MKNQLDKLLKQRLQAVHSIVGINLSILLYIITFFGIFTIFLPYIQIWEKPSRHIENVNLYKIDYEEILNYVTDKSELKEINPINIILPGYMQDPVIKINTRFKEDLLFNPKTKEKIQDEKNSKLANFLNELHYGAPLKKIGSYIFGLTAVGGMFLILGGIWLIIKVKYKKNSKSTTSKFSKWHRKIFIWIFIPFIIILLTGAIMKIGYELSSPMTYLSSKGETTKVWKIIGPSLFPKESNINKNNRTTKMLSLNKLIKKAKEINPNINYQKITLINWGDSSAIAKIEGYNPYIPFFNGLSNIPSVTLSGATGEMINQKNVFDRKWTNILYDTTFFLHILREVDIFTRLLTAFFMFLCILGLGFGILLYLEKKARKFPLNIPVYNGFGKFCLSGMIGVIPATGLLFFLQWLLPFDMENRFLIQKGLFAIFWIGTLTWAFYRINSYQAAKEFLYIGALFFVLSPFIHFYNSGFNPYELYTQNMINILSVDIGLFIFGALLYFVAKKLPSQRKTVQEFWAKRL
ncbi:ABC transporter permease [Halarcobacter mediterraneus]|uniref:ABC transporter permease n=1 Tax=Halarcobacter mediterraneus TaxID=2023153 RepID=A0A4Q1AYN4_9BACT|nr:PepSY-associated TM helix domain-containing protein [Halarcobacter mediterraneus]RXK14483.1 ABC transporter permease [Halarcobacter mediterraneus]